MKPPSHPGHHKPQGFVGKLLIALWVLPIPSMMILIASQLEQRKRNQVDDLARTNGRGNYGG